MPARGFMTYTMPFKAFQEERDFLAKYMQIGGRLIDTAPTYYPPPGGDALVRAAVLTAAVPREDLWITSKVENEEFWNPLSTADPREWASTQVDMSLRDLGTPYLDLVMLHWGKMALNLRGKSNYTLSQFIEMWRGLIDARSAGKARAIGVYAATQSEIEALVRATGQQPDVVPVIYHPWVPAEQKQHVAWLRSQGIAVTAYAALDYRWEGDSPEDRVRAADACGRRHNISGPQFVLQWLTEQGLPWQFDLYSKHRLDEWFVDLQSLSCSGFHTDARDAELLASAPPWTCQTTMYRPELLGGCAP